jgi:Protein of unknown function (DUF3551)
MRVPVLAVLALGAAYAAAPAQAQTYDPAFPVCLQVYQSMVDYYFDCTYQTIGQCQASASGRSASCVVNPYYRGRAAKPAYRKRSRHHY